MKDTNPTSSLIDTVNRIANSGCQFSTLSREAPDDPDEPTSVGFALFVGPGDDRQSAFIVEVSTAADNTGALCTVQAFRDGEPVETNVFHMLDGTLITTDW